MWFFIRKVLFIIFMQVDRNKSQFYSSPCLFFHSWSILMNTTGRDRLTVFILMELYIGNCYVIYNLILLILTNKYLHFMKWKYYLWAFFFFIISPLCNSVYPNNKSRFLFHFTLSSMVFCHIKVYIHCFHLILLCPSFCLLRSFSL